MVTTITLIPFRDDVNIKFKSKYHENGSLYLQIL